MKTDLRLLQVFLSTSKTPGPGVYEVSTDKAGALYCNCQDFKFRSKCKHTVFVNNRIKNNNGSYPLEILSKASQEDADRATMSNEDYRQFIIKYGKIEVF